MMEVQPRYLTYREAMAVLNVKSYHTLYTMIDEGLPVVRIGKSPRIDQADLVAFVNSRKEVKD